MVRKNTRYTVALFAWGLSVFGLTVAVFSGQAAPLLTPSMLPVSGPFGLFAFAGGLLVAGALLVGQFKKRAWRRAGRRADLTPEEGGLVGNPDLVGSVGGRPVRARTIKRKTGGGGESGSSKTTYTVVEADLREAATEGLVVSRSDSDGETEIGELTAGLETETVGDFEVVGKSRALAGDVLTTRARNALREPARLESVLVGNASEVILAAVPDSDGMIAGLLTDGIEQKVKRSVPGDAATVRTETKGMLLESDELEQQVGAVATVADEFENATDR